MACKANLTTNDSDLLARPNLSNGGIRQCNARQQIVALVIEPLSEPKPGLKPRIQCHLAIIGEDTIDLFYAASVNTGNCPSPGFTPSGYCMTCSSDISGRPHETGLLTLLHSHCIGSEPFYYDKVQALV